MSIGENIKNYRKAKRLTQVELADKANISRSYIADIERDRYNPSLDTLTAIANVLKVSANELLGMSSRVSEEDYAEGYTDDSNGLSAREERDIATDLERMIGELESNEALAFHGEPMDDETKELMRISLENSLRLAKGMAKRKFNPNKNKNK
ncbi:helix-turn-helix domain-containing protein [Paenibacillus alkaliterrae]|uniref:helix-turn-helix domain-containing protein n=1 Tax=Paenibacillus alkaliterrae TaxID=320909 RepID=UPI001F3D2190|nr:helix-turn-helix transcriptional regulator [Paenibacillus alkaliterrae]MCF2939006.1 helix-turn-helix domain-containing protein [Paenibacillus alkaliterrae]